MGKVICIENVTINKITFRKEEEYNGSKINEKWWVIDAIGVKAEDFDKYFIIDDNTKKEEKNNDAELNAALEET